MDSADVVAIGLASGEVENESSIPADFPSGEVVGVKTGFKIKLVLKGDDKLSILDVIHFVRAPGSIGIKNGPRLAIFRNSGVTYDLRSDLGLGVTEVRTGTPEYLMFLKKTSDGNYTPVTGQYDSMDSFREMHLPLPAL